MRRPYRNWQFIFVAFLIGVIHSCQPEEQGTIINQSAWSSIDPLSIPFQQRLNLNMQGNLVVNNSFENGRIYYENSKVMSFDIDGWKTVGDDVVWVSTKSTDFDSSEVFTGNHAVKISRNRADETEIMGHGVVSDYIKVIPGNYHLSLFLRLEDITSSRLRLGSKLMDAVHIRLQFYDKNKIILKSDIYNPDTDTYIDNGLKSLSLSNYWHITKMDWNQIVGRSASYPFIDGDIPDEARYVKMFIGLKGTGTLWVDDVDFRYSRANFSAAEKYLPYFDSIYNPVDFLQPNPKFAQYIDSLCYWGNDFSNPIILLPNKSNKREKEFAWQLQELIANNISKYSDEETLPADIKIKQSISDSDSLVRFIIDINSASDCYNLNDSIISGRLSKDNAYMIHTSEIYPRLLYINACDKHGYSAALNTLKQLFSSTTPYFYLANISDYPGLTNRTIYLSDICNDSLLIGCDLLESMTANQVFMGDRAKLNFIERKGSMNKNIDYGMTIDLNYIVQDIKTADFDYISVKRKFDKAYPDVQKKIRIAANRDISSFILVGGDFQNDHINELEFENQKACEYAYVQFKELYAELINKLNKWAKILNRDIQIYFLPPWNQNSLINTSGENAIKFFGDFSDLVSDDVKFICQGEQICAIDFDDANYMQLEGIYNREPIVWNNSISRQAEYLVRKDLSQYYSGKIRCFELFAPFNMRLPTQKSQESDMDLIIGFPEKEYFNPIQLKTVEEFLWNPSNYNPEFSYWKTLVNLYGKKIAREIILLSDNYFALLRITEDFKKSDNINKLIRQGDMYKRRLELNHINLSKSDMHKVILYQTDRLVTDLILRYNEQVKVYEKENGQLIE